MTRTISNARATIVYLLSVILLTFALSSLSPTPKAEARGTCTAGVICGSVKVHGDWAIRVTYSWGDVLATDRYVFPGHSSSEYGKDTDGVFVNKGFNVLCYDQWGTDVNFFSRGWHKINDLNWLTCHREKKMVLRRG